MYLRVRRYFACLIIAALGTPVAAQHISFGSVSRFYLSRQVSTTTVEDRGVLLFITVSVFGPNLSAETQVELRGAGVLIRVPRQRSTENSFLYERKFANRTALAQVLPDGNYTLFITGGLTTSTPIVIRADTGALQSRITNFDALQRWDGGPLSVSIISQPTRSSNSELTIFAGNRVVFSQKPVPTPTATVAVTNVNASAGETLRGDFSVTPRFQPPTFVYPGQFDFELVDSYSLEFPITRLPAPPVIAAQPRAQTVVAGVSATLSVEATGMGLAYQWSKDGVPITGATTGELTLTQVRATDSGVYTVVVSNSAGMVTSNPVALVVTAPPPTVIAPTISAGPANQSVKAGATLAFSATASGTPPLRYQWTHNGNAVAGGTSAVLLLEDVRLSDAGTYVVAVTNDAGSVTASAAELRVRPISRLSNLSILTTLESAEDEFTLGYVVQNAGPANPKPLVIRAAGPSLGALGLAGTAVNPKLELFAGSTRALVNDDWGGSSALREAFNAVGAFSYASPTSLDAAAHAGIVTGNNSVRISATGGGVVIAELYDATPPAEYTTATPRMINVSVLKPVGGGLTMGFVVTGEDALRVLVRAVGPTLAAAPFNVGDAIADPRLDVFRGETRIAENGNWGGAPALAAAFADVGAFMLPAGSRDAAVMVTLEPGNYTAQVTGLNNTTGMALVEVYELP